METGKSSGGGFVVVFLLFGTCVAITILMLLTALVVWLSEVMGSFIAATLILSGLFAAASAGIYLLAIREAVERIRSRAETVYEVARTARNGYEWVMRRVTIVTGLLDLLHTPDRTERKTPGE